MKTNAKYLMLDFANKTGKIKPINDEQQKYLHRILTTMISDIQAVCDKNGISLMAAYGTALGAYRHKGFIPWDDDADVCVIRKDWEKLRDNFDSYFKGKYILEAPQYGKNDTQMTWGKIYIPDTKFVEIFNEGTPYNKGIFLDVFVMDFLSDNLIVRRIDLYIAKFLRSAINSITYYRYPGNSLTQFMTSTKNMKFYFRMRQLLGLMMSFKTHREWCDIYDKFVSRHKKQARIGDYQVAIMSENEWLLPVKKIKFEDIQINVPNNIEKYLERIYGKTYMELPPIENREQHFCIEIDFGPV